MRNLDEVLQEKEMALLRVRQEVEALHLVALMLMESAEPAELVQPESASRNRWPLQVEGSHQQFAD